MDTATLHALVRQFHVESKEATRVQSGVYRVTTPKGEQFALKRMKHLDDSHLRFIDTTLCDVRRAGTHRVRIVWREENKLGGSPAFVRSREKAYAYVLTPWIDGRRPDARLPADLVLCAQTLANFHIAFGHLPTNPSFAPPATYWKLGTWPKTFRQHTAKMEKRIIEAGQQTGTLATLLQTQGGALLHEACEMENALFQSDYEAMCQSAQDGTTTICHGDCGDKNFVLTTEDAYLIDFETLCVDLPAFDIFRMIRLQGKANHFDPDLAMTMLNAYAQVRPLSHEELTLVVIWLRFPMQAARALRSHRVWADQERAARRLVAAMAQARRMRPLIDRLRAYAQTMPSG
ncbi:MAG: phosphotransferase [Firmicutes bacterium]|nr:phosphotransferase [Bacillota bacterium]